MSGLLFFMNSGFMVNTEIFEVHLFCRLKFTYSVDPLYFIFSQMLSGRSAEIFKPNSKTKKKL